MSTKITNSNPGHAGRPGQRGGSTPSDARVSDYVKARQAGEERARFGGVWQRLMTSSNPADDVGEISQEDAQRVIDGLNAAPGDNPKVREAIKGKYPDIHTEKPDPKLSNARYAQAVRNVSRALLTAKLPVPVIRVVMNALATDATYLANCEIPLDVDIQVACGLSPRKDCKMFNAVVDRWALHRVSAIGDQILNSAGVTPPTEAQKKAGNYKMHKTRFCGLSLVIETPSNSARSGTDRHGKSWESISRYDYGYVKCTGGVKKMGVDGDHVDIALSPTPAEDAKVYAVEQIEPQSGKPDENKFFLGYQSEGEARQAYLSGFADGSGSARLGKLTTLTMPEFKAWLKGKKKIPALLNANLGHAGRPSQKGGSAPGA